MHFKTGIGNYQYSLSRISTLQDQFSILFKIIEIKYVNFSKTPPPSRVAETEIQHFHNNWPFLFKKNVHLSIHLSLLQCSLAEFKSFIYLVNAYFLNLFLCTLLSLLSIMQNNWFPFICSHGSVFAELKMVSYYTPIASISLLNFTMWSFMIILIIISKVIIISLFLTLMNIMLLILISGT